MQAWGHSSRFNRRTSASWPVKSGIIGMLCAALGIEREDEAGIKRLSVLKMTVYTLKNEGRRLLDWHTVGGGFDESEEGSYFDKKHGQSVAILTDREYLLDCKFGVVLSGDAATVDECSAALENPKWGVWFGRKCCPPAARIFEGIFDSTEEARVRLTELGMSAGRVRVVRETVNFEDGTDSLMDVPLNFATREYQTRRIADEHQP